MTIHFAWVHFYDGTKEYGKLKHRQPIDLTAEEVIELTKDWAVMVCRRDDHGGVYELRLDDNRWKFRQR